MGEPLKGAILGFGRVVEAAHVPAFRNLASEFRIDAVADSRQDRLDKAAELFPGVRLYKKAEELLTRETELDFVDVATPPDSHPKLALLALQYRRHVLVEKPLALHLKDLGSLKAQAVSQDLSLFTVHNWKHAPLFAQVKRLIADGKLGEVRHVELHTLRTQPAAAEGGWRSDPALGGILVDHGWHAFYLLYHLLQEDPRMVTCWTRKASEAAGEVVSALVEFDRSTAMVYLSWAAAFRSNWGVVYGSEGTVELRDDHLQVRFREGPARTIRFPQRISEGSAHPDWFEAMLPEFAAEIRDPALRGRNLREAETCLRLVVHSHASQRMGGKSVSLPLAPSPAAGARA